MSNLKNLQLCNLYQFFIGLPYFTSLETIKLSFLEIDIIQFIEVIRTLKNLKKIDIGMIVDLNDDQVIAFQLFLLEELHQFEEIRLPRMIYMDCRQVQKNYPRIRFIWYIKNFNIISGTLCADFYEGNFGENNLFEGKGYLNSIGGGYRYNGEWKSGLREGKGTYILTEGTKYEGDWKNDVSDGVGTVTYRDGSRYQGESKWGLRDGIGEYIHVDGSKYDGEWKAGKMEGKGIFYNAIDGSKYEGEFKHDRKNGIGKVFLSDGTIYEGEFYNDRKVGIGKQINSDGTIYEGEWKRNKLDGKGTFTYPNGTKYEGFWKRNDNKEGKVLFYHIDGKIYEEYWNNGEMIKRVERKKKRQSPRLIGMNVEKENLRS
jgi:hypothetical protein